MEILKNKYNDALAALKTLERAIEKSNKFNRADKTKFLIEGLFDSADDVDESLRDIMLKRFEFSYETFWKFLKDYLEKGQGIALMVKSPREAFRAACQARITDELETDIAMKMIDSRNSTIHLYKEEMAIKIRAQIPLYHNLMVTILKRIKI